MKNLVILSIMLFTFGFANAQYKIYKDGEYGTRSILAMYEGGKIYKVGEYGGKGSLLGICEGGKIYKLGEYGGKGSQLGICEGGKIYKVGGYGGSRSILAMYEGGKIYKIGEYGGTGSLLVRYEGDIEGAAAAAFILFFSGTSQNKTTSNKTYQTYNYVEQPKWWNEPSNLPKWVENYTCINDVGWYSKTDREDKIQVRTPDGEDYLYLYKDGKVIYENKVKAILNGTWKCLAGNLYMKTDDGYEWTKKSGWRRQGAKPIPDWAETCIWEVGDVESSEGDDKVKVSTNDGEDNLYFYKSGKFVYENKVKNTLNGTWKCVSERIYINTDDGFEYTKDGGWVKKQ